MNRTPTVLRIADLLEPAPQVDTHVLHFAFPDAWNRGRKVLLEAGSDVIQHAIGNIQSTRQPPWRDGKQFGFLERREQLELNGVKQSSARQRIHLLERDWSFAGTKLKDRLQQEPIRASSEML